MSWKRPRPHERPRCRRTGARPARRTSECDLSADPHRRAKNVQEQPDRLGMDRQHKPRLRARCPTRLERNDCPEHTHPNDNTAAMIVTWIYFVWIAVEFLRILVGHRRAEAFPLFAHVWRDHVRRPA